MVVVLFAVIYSNAVVRSDDGDEVRMSVLRRVQAARI